MKCNRILFVGMYPHIVSPYRNVFFRNLIYAIADSGVECTVISPVPVTKYLLNTFKIPRITEDITPEGNKVKVYYPRVISASSKQIGIFNTEKISEYLFEQSILNEVKRIGHDFDCVYGHFFLYGGLAAIKVGRKYNMPSFVAFGECDYETQVQETFGDLTNKHIKGLSGVIAVSTKNAGVLKKLGIFDSTPVIIAPNSVDMTLFYKRDKSECRRKLGIPEDKFVVGFVGGFIERKGDKRLLEAVNQIDDTYVAFAGRGDNPPCGDRVVFCKALSHDDVPVFLNAVDVFCLPTLSEGSCNAIVEAAACGLPIISSDLEFNDDLLTDDNSIRINPNSIEEIKKAIERIKNNKAEGDIIAERVYDDSKKFSIKERADRILTFIYDVIVGDDKE